MNNIRANLYFIKNFLSEFQLQDFFYFIQKNCLETFFKSTVLWSEYLLHNFWEQIGGLQQRTGHNLCIDTKALRNAVLTYI